MSSTMAAVVGAAPVAPAGRTGAGDEAAAAAAGRTPEKLDELEKTWDAVFGECSTGDAKKISKSERNTHAEVQGNLVYGEVSFASLGDVLWAPQVKIPPGGVFYDLGSGTGRGVVAAALLHDFRRCVGVEVLRGLHDAAERVLAKWDLDVRPFLDDARKDQRLEFVHGSFLEEDWSDATVVFANSTCFEAELMAQIAEQCERLQPGAVVITLTKKLERPCLRLVMSKQQKMSWGFATVHVHERK